jgi:hypothetical protein
MVLDWTGLPGKVKVKCGALWHSRELDTALKLIRTYLYLYMHVYKGVRLSALANLSVHMCKEQIRAENTFDFPIYVYFNYPSYQKICSEHFLKLSLHLYNGLKSVLRNIFNYHTTFSKKNVLPWHAIISAKNTEEFIVMTSPNKWHLYRYEENSPTSVTVWQLWFSAGYIKTAV